MGGRESVGKVSNVSLSRSEARPQIRFTGQICKCYKVTQIGYMYSRVNFADTNGSALQTYVFRFLNGNI